MTETESANAEDIIGNIFGHDDDVVDGEDPNLFLSLEKIIKNDTAIDMVTARFGAVDKEKFRSIALPLLGILRNRGVEIFSAGDSARAARLESGFGAAASYASLVTEFLPLLQTLYGFMKEGKQVPNLADDEWDGMMFEEEIVNNNEPQVQQEIDPNFVGPPPGQMYSSQANTAPPPPPKSGLSMESIMKNHMKKYGSTGMGKVVKELEKDGLTIDMVIKENVVSPDIYAKEKAPTNASAGPLKNMTMKDLVERHQQQYGDEGMGKVMEEMDRAGLDSEGIDFEDQKGETAVAAQEAVATDDTEDQRQFFDDDGDADAKANFQDTAEMAKVRRKLSDMPQISRDSLFDE